MSTVTLQAIWVNLAADPSEFRELPYVTAYSTSLRTQAAVRLLANGRQRVVRRAGEPVALTVTGEMSRADVLWLEEHVGETMCFRDDVGRKVFGIFSEVPVSEHTLYRDRPTVTLQVQSLSFDEAV